MVIMADDDWESREDFDEILKKPVPKKSDKWSGEDEDLDVKDNWDDEDTTTTEKAKPVVADVVEKATQQKSGKKKFNKMLKEKEKVVEELSLEQQAALKLEEEKLREAHELQIVKEAFGSSAISDSDPVTKDDFDALRRRIVNDLLPFEKRVAYPDFVEELIQDLALALPSKRLKKVKTTVEALYFEKTKAEKVTKGPTGKTPKSKAKLYVEGDRAVLKGNLDEDLDDYEDFM